jgi:hypothetical protein
MSEPTIFGIMLCLCISSAAIGFILGWCIREEQDDGPRDEGDLL